MKKVIRQYRFFAVVIVLFIIATSIYANVVEVSMNKFNGVTIVLDAGHGGRDGGSIGKNGTIEKDINLKYVMALKEKLVEVGYKVVLTRKDNDGLYDNLAKNKKQDDMNKRMEIIKQANPNLVISIHMNSFKDSSAFGATTYYRKDDESSKVCADLIQKSISTYCNAKEDTAKEGDYFMLNCSYYTAVLVECGFISNANEESMLNSDEYKERMVNSIFNGIVLYFGEL